MSNSYFQFKQFTVNQDRCAMKVTTDGCLFGAWTAGQVSDEKLEVRNTLDIGTGTGLLSLMLAQKNPETIIDAIEIDPEAAEQARANVAASPWSDRINVIHGNAKDFTFTRKYDIILSNPPFYEKELKGDDDKKNTAHHDGGLLLPELLTIIKQQLAPRGRFYLLLPYKRNEEIKELLLRHQMQISQLVLVKQSTSHSYFRILIEGTLATDEPLSTIIDELSIKDERGQYSPEFTELLKEYYLYL